MSGESQLPPDTVPDPSTATMDAITRGDRAEREFMLAQIEILRTRLDGMDEATRVLNETVTRTPTDIQQAVGALKELTDVKFDGVQRQFAGDKIAVDAAFAAQEKLGVQQNAASQLAIDKAEKSTTESIRILGDSQKQADAGLAEKIDDVRVRVGAIESLKQGGQDERTEHRTVVQGKQAGLGGLYAALAAATGLVLAVLTVIAFATR